MPWRSKQGLPFALWLGAHHWPPRSIPGVLPGPDKLPPISPPASCNRWPDHAPAELRGCLDQAHRAAAPPAAPGARHQAGETGAQHHHINELSLGRLGVVPGSPPIAGQVPRLPDALGHGGPQGGPRRLAARIAGLTDRPADHQQGGAGRQGLMWSHHPGLGRRRALPLGRMPGCPTSRKGAGGGLGPPSRPTHGGADGTAHTGGHARAARRELWRSGAAPTASSSQSDSGSQLGEHRSRPAGWSAGQSRALRRFGHRRRLGRRQCLAAGRSVHRDQLAPRRAGRATARAMVAGDFVVEFQIQKTRRPRRRSSMTSAGPQAMNNSRPTSPSAARQAIHQRRAKAPLGNRAAHDCIRSAAFSGPTLGSQGSRNRCSD